MPFCEQCGSEIGYLPFNCNYCGGTFCKQHRLPENHECSFELKHKPVIPTTSKKIQQIEQEIAHPIAQERLYDGPKQLKKYLKRQEKERKRTKRVAQPRMRTPMDPKKMGNGTLFIILMVLIFSAIEIGRLYILSTYFGIDIIYLPAQYLTAEYIWRLISSPFIYTQNYIGFFFLFIIVCFLRFMGKMIEDRNGTKFLLKYYFLCVAFNWMIHALIMLPLVLTVQAFQTYPIIPSISASAAVLGIIALLIVPMLNRQVTGLMGFFPVRTRGRTFLILIILFVMLPALMGLLYDYPIDYKLYLFVISVADLGGILVAFLISYEKIRLKS